MELDPQRGGAHVRVWAPAQPRVTLVIERVREVVLDRVAGGFHVAFVPNLHAGSRYHFRLAGDATAYPDPASRAQPDGPTGASAVVDAAAFPWTDGAWRGLPPDAHVLYELHVGTFTPEGTWAAASEQLPYLAELGVTTLEIMPVAECAGRYNWGYDGVCFYAPSHHYGTPDDFRRFVDRAHACGLAVILDVVYNHFGPSGDTLPAFGPYQHQQASEWGAAPNFDDPAVREWACENAAYWIRDFHLDGLRFDALHAIGDQSVIAELTRAARAAAPGRTLFLVGEDEPQVAALLDCGLDALWNDDFHHAARVALLGVHEGYLQDYRGTPQELVSAIKRGFLYQGQRYAWQKQARGQSTRGRPRRSFVHFLENHDQIANLSRGERLDHLADRASVRALTAVLLLSPELPMLFQGQEYGSRRPWHFFVDHEASLHEPIRKGRAEFFAQFPRLATTETQASLVDPNAEQTFRDCVLDARERQPGARLIALHRDLIALRKRDRALADPDLDGAVLDDRVFLLRWPERLLVVNLGATWACASVAEPLVAPPAGTAWQVAWSSEDPAYGGYGTPPPITDAGFAMPARAAILFAAAGGAA